MTEFLILVIVFLVMVVWLGPWELDMYEDDCEHDQPEEC